MNSRERIQAALRFESPDRLPRSDSFWQQTLRRWQSEGMPADVAPADFFDFDIRMTFLDPSPRFPMVIRKRKDGFITYEDRYGYTIRKEDGGESTLEFLEHRNLNRDTWEREIRPRLVLDPNAEARLDTLGYFAHFDPYPSWEEAVRKHRALYQTDRYVLCMMYGPWEAAWRHRGMEPLLMDLLVDPEWVEDMVAAHVDLLLDTLKHSLTLGARPDGVLWAEDLGANSGPLFSPVVWDALFRPHMQRFSEYVHAQGIDFWFHSDGKLDLYVDRLIDVGVQVLNPLQVRAGMDAVELRERVGNNLVFYGNISATGMAGPQAVLEQELLRKIPVARAGGFIMHSDHSVPPDVSFGQYQWMQERAQQIFAQR